MKNILLLILISLLGIKYISAQDQIKRKDGSEINCKITSIDSSTIYFNYPIGETSFFSSNIDLLSVYSFTNNGQTTILKDGKVLSIVDDTRSDITLINPLNIIADSIENLNKYFIYTYSNEVLFGDKISYETRIFESPYIKYNSEKKDPDKVKFFKNEMGFYANTKDINFSGTSDFTTRIIKGRVNLYETEKITYGAYGGSSKKIKNFYNIGFGELKNVNYRNLSIDLASNPESMNSLKKYKSISKTQTILCVAGGAILAGGIVSLINQDTDKNPNIAPSLVAIGIGSGCFFVSGTIYFSKLGHLENAIDAFNK